MEIRRPHPEETPASRLVIDERYEYRGYHSDGGITRVRLYDRGESSPVMMLSELPENRNTSVTNMLEYLVAELGTMLMPHRFDYEEPFTVIEHYPADPTSSLREVRQERYARVEFADWKLRKRWMGGVERKLVGQPAWKHLEKHQVEELLGLRLPEPG